MKKYYLSTAIPYVNYAPHLGFAFEIVQAYVIARYHRLLGEDVFFLTGTDENSLKNVQAAKEAGIPVETFVERNAEQFYHLKKALNFTQNKQKHSCKNAQKHSCEKVRG